MIIEVIKDILFFCSCSILITVPLFISLISGRHNQKKYMSKEEYEKTSFKKWDMSERWLVGIIATGAILGSLYSPMAFFKCGNTQIGSLLEKSRYTENYYVYMRTADSASKMYKLEATIRRDKFGDDEHSFDGYYIEELRFDNGGYIVFTTPNETPHPTEELKPYKETEIEAKSGKCYYITLTKEKVSKGKHP